MITRLISENGIPIIENEQRFELLTVDCKEHWNGDLIELASQEYGSLKVSWHRCATKVTQ